MTTQELVLAAMALMVGLLLARKSGPLTGVLLFASAVLIAGLLFLPGSQLTSLVGGDAVRWMTRMAADTPWSVSDWMHFVIFVWLGALTWLARPDLRGRKAWALLVVLAVAAELAQGFAPDRETRFDDVLLNLVGGAAGLVIGIGLKRVQERFVLIAQRVCNRADR